MFRRTATVIILFAGLLLNLGCPRHRAIAAERVVPLHREVYAAEVKAALASVSELSYDNFSPSTEVESFGIFPRWGRQVDATPAWHSFHAEHLGGHAQHDDPGRNVTLELWPREDVSSRRTADALRDEGEALLDRIEAELRRKTSDGADVDRHP